MRKPQNNKNLEPVGRGLYVLTHEGRRVCAIRKESKDLWLSREFGLTKSWVRHRSLTEAISSRVLTLVNQPVQSSLVRT
jgi:hypothetical protein